MIASTAGPVHSELTFAGKIYPNPATNYLFINYAEPVTKIVIYNLMGEILKQDDVDNTNFLIKIDVSNLKEGTYLLFISNKSKVLFTKLR